MAIIHRTTMSPGKLELLAAWLPTQPWYHAAGRAPELARAGGFRLDDPQGEVGIEFMVVTDGLGSGAAAYQVPMTYRAQAFPGADGSLIGTAEHGVLGPRWIYDGTQDPALATQLAALIQGEAEPQAQSVSHTPDPTVTIRPVTEAALTVTGSAVVAGGPYGTDLWIQAAGTDGAPGGQLMVRIHRALRPGDTADADAALQPCLWAPWRLPDGPPARGVLASAQYRPATPA
jgi:Maltokinase N-terminal cap domain